MIELFAAADSRLFLQIFPGRLQFADSVPPSTSLGSNNLLLANLLRNLRQRRQGGFKYAVRRNLPAFMSKYDTRARQFFPLFLRVVSDVGTMNFGLIVQ